MQNRFKSSSLRKRIDKKSFDIINISKFDFEKGLISKNDKENNFTNFFKCKEELGYELIEEYYIRFLDNDYSFLDEFEVGYLTSGDRVNRLFDIIKSVQKIKYKNKDLAYIIKLNSVRDKKLHFYIRQNRNNLSLILIDLYHLGIFGEYYINGKPQKSSIGKLYKRNKNNKIDLAEFKR